MWRLRKKPTTLYYRICCHNLVYFQQAKKMQKSLVVRTSSQNFCQNCSVANLKNAVTKNILITRTEFIFYFAAVLKNLQILKQQQFFCGNFWTEKKIKLTLTENMYHTLAERKLCNFQYSWKDLIFTPLPTQTAKNGYRIYLDILTRENMSSIKIANM